MKPPVSKLTSNKTSVDDHNKTDASNSNLKTNISTGDIFKSALSTTTFNVTSVDDDISIIKSSTLKIMKFVLISLLTDDITTTTLNNNTDNLPEESSNKLESQVPIIIEDENTAELNDGINNVAHHGSQPNILGSIINPSRSPLVNIEDQNEILASSSITTNQDSNGMFNFY